MVATHLPVSDFLLSTEHSGQIIVFSSHVLSSAIFVLQNVENDMLKLIYYFATK